MFEPPNQSIQHLKCSLFDVVSTVRPVTRPQLSCTLAEFFEDASPKVHYSLAHLIRSAVWDKPLGASHKQEIILHGPVHIMVNLVNSS